MPHTPGPWRIGVGGLDDGKRCLSPQSLNVYEVQTNHHRGYWPSIWCLTQADAQLVSAAPDLAEENARLKEVVAGMAQSIKDVFRSVSDGKSGYVPWVAPGVTAAERCHQALELAGIKYCPFDDQNNGDCGLDNCPWGCAGKASA